MLNVGNRAPIVINVTQSMGYFKSKHRGVPVFILKKGMVLCIPKFPLEKLIVKICLS
jgi:hypothetical protein